MSQNFFFSYNILSKAIIYVFYSKFNNLLVLQLIKSITNNNFYINVKINLKTKAKIISSIVKIILSVNLKFKINLFH